MKIPFLSGSINAGRAFETISKGVDNLAFTAQERAKLNEQLADKVATFAEKTLNENTIRSKSRRFISYLIVVSYILALLTACFYSSDTITYIIKNSALKTGFVMVLAFFFGGYYINQVQINGKTKTK